MVDVVSKRCKEPGCGKQPNFGVKGQRPTRCAAHKTDGMVEVVHTRCEEPGCGKSPTIGVEGQRPTRCAAHKTDGMVNVVSKRCNESGCRKQPKFGLEGQRPTRCITHKTNDMVNVVNKRCKSAWCNTTIATQNKYDDFCCRCFIHIFPDKTVSRNYKVKEQTVVDLIKDNLDPVFAARCPPVFDRAVDRTACGSKRRPDVCFDLLTHVLIVEIDEDQHKGYDQTCENKRSMELFQDFGGRPLVMIRFNPDAYKCGGVTFKSSFVYSKTGLCRVRDAKEWTSRGDALMDAINNQLRLTFEENRVPDKTFDEIKLYFDS